MAKEKLDFLTKLRIRELILMGLITITAVLANLPHEYVEETLGISHGTLLAVLAIAVIIGLFLYLKFGLFVAVILLIAGANMPDQIAEGLNISRIPIVLALRARRRGWRPRGCGWCCSRPPAGAERGSASARAPGTAAPVTAGAAGAGRRALPATAW